MLPIEMVFFDDDDKSAKIVIVTDQKIFQILSTCAIDLQQLRFFFIDFYDMEVF